MTISVFWNKPWIRRHRIFLGLLILLVDFALGGCRSLATKAPLGVIDQIDREGAARVIVLLETSQATRLYCAAAGSCDAVELHGRAEGAILARAPSGQVEVLTSYPHLSMLHLQVSGRKALAYLVTHPLVARIFESGELYPILSRSLPAIGVTAVNALGVSGDGVTVAVIDTGIDWSRPVFGCSQPGNPSSCRVAQSWDCTSGSGCVMSSAIPVNSHGTHVGEIAARAASGSKIVSFNVCNGSCPASWLLSALDKIVELNPVLEFAAVNVSLGDPQTYYSTPCNGSVYQAPFKVLRGLEILPIVASGNDAYSNQTFKDGITEPACAPAAVSVGAVFGSDTYGNTVPEVAVPGGCVYALPGSGGAVKDKVCCFSQTADFLGLLAPGFEIEGQSGWKASGTSVAAPHVTGAVALMRSSRPSATSSEILDCLMASGLPVTDPRNGSVTPRVDLARAFTPGLSTRNFGDDMWFGGGTADRKPMVGDFNGDGYADIAYQGVCGSGDACWRVHVNDQKGKLWPANYGGDMWFGGTTADRTPMVGDFNGDGYADIAYQGVCGSGDACWRVHVNDQKGKLWPANYGGDMWFGGTTADRTPMAGDFNGDGYTDIAYQGVCGSGEACWRVHVNDQKGKLWPANYGGDMWFGGTTADRTPMAGDFNGDGYADIAYQGVCGSGEACWRVHVNDQKGKLWPANYGGDMWFGGSTADRTPMAGDFNGDGYTDIVYQGVCGSGTACWRGHLNDRNGKLVVRSYGGDMWFQGQSPIHVPMAGDFNGDGSADIAYYGLCGAGDECWRVHASDSHPECWPL